MFYSHTHARLPPASLLPAGDEAEVEEEEEQGGEEEGRGVCRDKRSEAAKCGKNRAATRPRFLERAVKRYERCLSGSCTHPGGGGVYAKLIRLNDLPSAFKAAPVNTPALQMLGPIEKTISAGGTGREIRATTCAKSGVS